MNIPDPEELVESCIQQLKHENRIPLDYKLSYEAWRYIKEVTASDLFDSKFPMPDVARSIISFVIGYRFHELEGMDKNPIGFKIDKK